MEPFGVLLVDDNDDLRKLLELNLMLAEQPWQIRHVRGPEEIDRVSNGFVPSVVVVDGGYASPDHPSAGLMVRERFPRTWIISFSGTPGSHPWADASVLKGTLNALDQVIDAVQWATRRGASAS
jgi:DNA-binding NtrC family response regulator